MSTCCGICREETAWSSEQTTSWVEARRVGVLCVTQFTARLATESPKQAGRGRNLRQPEVVCISGEKPSLKGEHWCQESWMANDKRRPPSFQLGHDRSREVPTSPKRSRQVPRGPDKSQQVSASPVRSCQVSSGPGESPVDSLLNSSPCPDANSVKFCQVPTPILSSSVRSQCQSCQILSGQVLPASRRSTSSPILPPWDLQLPLFYSHIAKPVARPPLFRFVTLVFLLRHWRHRPPEKMSRKCLDPKPGSKDSVPPVRLSACPLSVCHCAICQSDNRLSLRSMTANFPSSGRGVIKAAGTKKWQFLWHCDMTCHSMVDVADI